MASVREEVVPSRIELVVLACLSQSRPPSDGELGDALAQLSLSAAGVEAARARAQEVLAAVVRRGWANPDEGGAGGAPRRGAAAPRRLTDDGKRALRRAFDLTRTPTWAQVRDRYLPALALGVKPGPALASAVCTETALTAAVLSERVSVTGAHTALAVCDALIAETLGMPAGKLTLDKIRAHMLMRRAGALAQPAGDAPDPGTKGYASKLAAWMAGNAVGATGTHRRMARALARRWASGQARPAVGDAAVPPRNGTPTPVEPRDAAPGPDLLDVVRDTIPRIGGEGRFGEKVYVSAIWRSMERDHTAGDLSFDHFKRWLIGANRDGKLVLARADLVGAMDATQVRESEIQDRGATFHFVLDPRNSGARSHQESHAR